MKKSELKQIIKEEIRKVLKEQKYYYDYKDEDGEIIMNIDTADAILADKELAKFITRRYFKFNNKGQLVLDITLMDDSEFEKLADFLGIRQLMKKSELTEIIKEEVKRALREGDDFNGPGLIVTGRTQIDNNKISDLIDDGDFYGVWNARERYWFFPEDGSTIDALEMELEHEFGKLGINARFEMQS